MRDYIGEAGAYAKKVLADTGRKKSGVWLRMAAERFERDLATAQRPGSEFFFSDQEAIKACQFIELMPHVEGVWKNPDGTPQLTIVLHPAHVFFIVNLFGFRKRSDGTRRFTTALLAVARKNAKALALDTPVPTPSGWTTMGDLQPGDKVFGRDGMPCNVTGISEVYLDHDCFRLKFSNGEEVTADAGHRWLTTARVDNVGGDRRGNRQTKTRVRTTEEIAATLRYGARGDVNHSIDMPDPIFGRSVQLPIAPYTLGAWLGDGHSDSARLTSHKDDGEIVDAIRGDGWPVREMGTQGNSVLYSLSDGNRAQSARNISLASKLREAGVLSKKHIPQDYLRASTGDRIALLQGLMDTDGTISKNGRILSFCNTNDALTAGVAELLASLGIKYSWRRDPLVCNGVPVPGIGHKLQFMAFRDEIPAFRLKRKLDRMRRIADADIAPRSRTVQIVAADRVQSVPVKCITVDSPDHLFLFGKTMIPTHNSTLAAAILLYCLCCEHDMGHQVLSAATTGKQAGIIFNVARGMVQKTPGMRSAFGLEAFSRSIARYPVSGSFSTINSKASTQDGLNPSHVGIDEIHAHKDGDLLNVLGSAAGARRSPLFLYTTTEGFNPVGPWEEIRYFARQILQQVVQAEHFFVLFYALDEGDDEFDPANWEKANPLIDVNPLLAQSIAKEALEAKSMPGKHAEFKVKRCNLQATSAKAWIDLSAWRECGGKVDLDFLTGKPCYAGVDLSSTSDLTSARFVWNVDDVLYTFGRRWVPEQAVRHRTARGTLLYGRWIEEGRITQTPGDAVDYAFVEKQLREDFDRFSPKIIAFDSWNAQELCGRLIADGYPMVRFIQGFASYHPPMQEIERRYKHKLLAHGNDPVLQWCASNVVPRYDVNMSMAPDKKRSPDKIDDIAALLMAVGVMLTDSEPTPDYDLVFV